ncbi:hypothetical protein [Persephonella sp.]
METIFLKRKAKKLIPKPHNQIRPFLINEEEVKYLDLLPFTLERKILKLSLQLLSHPDQFQLAPSNFLPNLPTFKLVCPVLTSSV